MGFQAKMPKTREINWNRPGVPPMQNPGMNDVVGLHSSMLKPTLLLKGSSMASSLENIDNTIHTQNKRTRQNNISYTYKIKIENVTQLLEFHALSDHQTVPLEFLEL